ncbi:hypothetical protein J3U75_07610 [Snodgrassella sp. B3088]|uniref:hypothetical protein n=1 Tax=Snodgrassella sp. B3088 TaxID=2818038 RepID=UPI0022699E32|nr:hypothetical protein [Snodgrassella sp. B3088]MCX8749248.1 hypothetical protein [Snodgrassella sp. B3088]
MTRTFGCVFAINDGVDLPPELLFNIGVVLIGHTGLAARITWQIAAMHMMCAAVFLYLQNTISRLSMVDDGREA